MPASRLDPIASDLLTWYDAAARSLPWRAAPGTPAPDPWAVLLSETMLQQTTVATVLKRYVPFLARFPSAAAMAQATEADVLAQWAGLGYYARARHLHAAARAITVHGMPRTEAGFAALPGVGAYTAAAVAAIAFGAPTTVIDANVARVAARLFALPEPLPAGRAALASALGPLVPSARPGDFAQACMDLGATLCVPRRPRCLACPIARHCRARASGDPEAFPQQKPRRLRPLRHGIAWWIEAGGHVALVRRPAHGLFGGMLGLPGPDWTPEPPIVTPPFPAHWQPMPAIRHGFTHFELSLVVHATKLAARLAFDEPLLWHRTDLLETAGLPSLFRAAARPLLASSVPASIEAPC